MWGEIGHTQVSRCKRHTWKIKNKAEEVKAHSNDTSGGKQGGRDTPAKKRQKGKKTQFSKII